MANQIYSKENYSVYPTRSGFIVHNREYGFEEAHTHVRRVYDAKKLIHHALTRTIPRKYNLRFLGSLIRITRGKFRKKVETLKEAKERKGKKDRYINIQKGGV